MNPLRYWSFPVTDGKAAADLATTLSGPGPFTVFAPTNDAFTAALTELSLTKAQLLAMQDGQRVARFAENGERVVLDDAEHEAEVERLSKYVARNCK